MEAATQEAVGLFVDTEGRGPSIHTYTGGRFYVLRPCHEEVELEDIAHSLANLCRYNGHTKHFYSVAQHSVYVSQVLLDWTGDRKLALLGLLHDAAEAYMGDVTRPLKAALDERAPGVLRKVEDRIQEAILERFALGRAPAEIVSGTYQDMVWETAGAAWVKQADNVVLAAEMRDLLGAPKSNVGKWGGDLPEPHPGMKVRPWSPTLAAEEYQAYFQIFWRAIGRRPLHA